VGPEAGVGGGEIVAMGRPEEVMAEPRSHTGRFLKRVLLEPVPAAGEGAPVAAKKARARKAS